MERILHRVNSLTRLRAGAEAGFDRLELDLHHRAGRFVVSHDLPLGRFAVGLVGVEFPTGRRRLFHRQGTFLELDSVLEAQPPPLYVDLKGPWTEPALRSMLAALRARGREGDLVGSG